MLVLFMLLVIVLKFTEDAEQHSNCKYHHNSNIIFETSVYMMSSY